MQIVKERKEKLKLETRAAKAIVREKNKEIVSAIVNNNIDLFKDEPKLLKLTNINDNSNHLTENAEINKNTQTVNQVKPKTSKKSTQKLRIKKFKKLYSKTIGDRRNVYRKMIRVLGGSLSKYVFHSSIKNSDNNDIKTK